MRTIKYRAWDKKGKKMRAVDSIAFHYEKANFDHDRSRFPKVINLWGHDMIEDKPIILHRESDDCVLVQFTGLIDKNGVEIYEGDIFEHDEYVPPFKRKVRLVVGFRDGQFQCGHAYQKEWINLHLANFNQNCEIIGNVFSNPELLKEGAV